MEHQRKDICPCWLARDYQSLQWLHGWSGQDGLSHLHLSYGPLHEKIASKSHSSSSFNEFCQHMGWIQGEGSSSGQRKEEHHGFFILSGTCSGSTMQSWDKSKATRLPNPVSKACWTTAWLWTRKQNQHLANHECRYDDFYRWPQPNDFAIPQRCKMEGCKDKSCMLCEKCNLYLCLTKGRNCFKDFHSKWTCIAMLYDVLLWHDLICKRIFFSFQWLYI